VANGNESEAERDMEEQDWIRRGRPRGRVQPFRESTGRSRALLRMTPSTRRAHEAMCAFWASYTGRRPSGGDPITVFRESYGR